MISSDLSRLQDDVARFWNVPVPQPGKQITASFKNKYSIIYFYLSKKSTFIFVLKREDVYPKSHSLQQSKLACPLVIHKSTATSPPNGAMIVIKANLSQDNLYGSHSWTSSLRTESLLAYQVSGSFSILLFLICRI